MSAVREECVKRIAGLRAECLQAGIEPAVLGDLLVEEALLAWMMSGLSEQEINQRATEKLRRDLREWFFRARTVTGQCDCVREVHMNGMLELKNLLRARTPESEEVR